MVCRHKQVHKFCSGCKAPTLKDCNCTHPSGLVDASFLLQTLEGQYADEARNYIEDHGNRHIITVTPLILGEVLKRLVKDAGEPHAKSWLNANCKILSNMNIVEIPMGEPLYIEVIQGLMASGCRCLQRDQIHIGTAAILGIPFLFYDGKIKEDQGTIDKTLKAIDPDLKFRPHKLSR